MITINQYVNVSKKRLELINRITTAIMGDLGLYEVNIEIEPASEMQSAEGYCFGECWISIINKRSVDDLFEVIAHELRHCYQHLNGLIDRKSESYKCRYHEDDAEKYEKIALNKFGYIINA